MSNLEHSYDELERLMALALQSAGDLIPSGLDLGDLEEDVGEIPLPPCLQDLDLVVSKVLSGTSQLSDNPVIGFPTDATGEFGLIGKAARHGVDLSQETLRKIEDILQRDD